MQAAVVPAVHGKWEVKEVPTPHPATNQVLIKMHASGLCYTDVHITEGHLPTSASGSSFSKLLVMGYLLYRRM
jgi:alcohol dehydrogenase